MHSAEPPVHGRFSTGFHWNTFRLTAHGNPTRSGHTSGRFPLLAPLLLKPLANTFMFKFGPWESQIIDSTPFHYYIPKSRALSTFTPYQGQVGSVQVVPLFSFKTGGRVQGLPLLVRSSFTLFLCFSSEGLTFLTCYLRLLSFLVRAPLQQRSKVDKVLHELHIWQF